jgi:Mor family transcriptional regulator
MKPVLLPEDRAKRNREITHAYNAGGVTLRALGKRYGLSHDRVRQIVIKTNRGDERRNDPPA